jgi:hypothetical protein
MDEVFAWVEDQRDRNRNDFYRFLEQQRNRWMPNHVFNRCCVKWLVDGNYTWDEFQDEYSFRNGCQGNCGREHPRIVLDFDVTRKVTTATLSHPELAPFQRYFQERVNQETAWVRDRSSYELNGFIRENQTKLRTQQYFGSHLVTVANGALEASDAAQREQLEEARPAKRPKTSSATDVDVLEKAMTIVLRDKSLGEELDLFSLYCLRQTSRFFRSMAMEIATSRLKAAKFYIIPLTDGMEKSGDMLDGFNDESWEITDDYGLSAVQYHRCANVAFKTSSPAEDSIEENRLGGASFVPSDMESAEFKWDSGYLYDNADEDDSYKKPPESYCGQKLRVFWRPETVDGVEEKPRLDTDMHDRPLPSLGVEIAKFEIGDAPKTGLNVRTSRTGVTVEFEVLESLEETGMGLDEDEPEEECTCYSGRARIVKLKVDFGALVRQHALQLFRNTRREHARIERERPLKASEVAHLQLIEAATKLG